MPAPIGPRHISTTTSPACTRSVPSLLMAAMAAGSVRNTRARPVMRNTPSESTTLLMFEVYRNAFVYTRFGYASAISTALLLVIALAVSIQMRFLRVEFEY